MQSQPSFEFPPVAFVDLSGFRVAYREWGRADAAQTIVLIHGLTSSSLSWIRVAPVLARRYRVLAVDLKGHGDSARTPGGYQLAEQAREVAAFCAALGLRNVTVMGHSWGGAIALMLATSTNLVNRLILDDPAIGERDPDRQQWARDEEFFASLVGLSRAEAEQRAPAYLAQGWTLEDVAGKIDAAMKGSPAAVRAIFADNWTWTVHDLLPAVRCPTLLVHAPADRDGAVDAEALALARANPDIRELLLPEADHNIHRTAFDAFMNAIEPFLAGEGG